MERKPLKLKDIMIAIAIVMIIGIITILGQNYIKTKSQKEALITEYSSALKVQIMIADKNIKYKIDEKVLGNTIYIYFYADDLYTENNYGNGYLEIDFKTDIVNIKSDTDKLKDILMKVKYEVKS